MSVFQVSELLYEAGSDCVRSAPVDRSLLGERYTASRLVLYLLAIVDERHTIKGELKHCQRPDISAIHDVFGAALILKHVMIHQIDHSGASSVRIGDGVFRGFGLPFGYATDSEKFACLLQLRKSGDAFLSEFLHHLVLEIPAVVIVEIPVLYERWARRVFCEPGDTLAVFQYTFGCLAPKFGRWTGSVVAAVAVYVEFIHPIAHGVDHAVLHGLVVAV